MSSPPPWMLSVSELNEAVRARRFKVREIVESCLGRIQETNPGLNAIVTLSADAALASADDCDRRLSRGALPRRLEGVPFVVKDNIVTSGVRTTFGSRVFENNVPTEDSLDVERMKAEGAIVIGKTNTPEFAHEPNTSNLVFGATRNPWDVRRSAGGSSGGNGSALAAGMVPAAIGTDLGGSVRLPAAFCGITAIRPVPGRIPIYPTEFGWDTLVEHVRGPMARTVHDLGLLLRVLAGPDDRDPSSLPEDGLDFINAASGGLPTDGARIAYSRTLGGKAPMDPAVAGAVESVLGKLSSLGYRVEAADPDISDVKEIIGGTRAFAIMTRWARYFESDRELLSVPMTSQVLEAQRYDVPRIANAERLRTAYWHRIRTFMEPYDFIITPTTGVTAFRIDEPLPTTIGGSPVENFYDAILFTYAFSLTGLPAMSVPCGTDSNGLPIGLQIIGPRLREDKVLALGAVIEALSPRLGWPSDATTQPVPLTSVVSTPGFTTTR